ncbi:cellulose binding domain-containing protein [Micromonospora parathelypteridis]|uniref:Cellulase/cellobiase CelA1 n=1 Tax=Micromonospora parathelypteridis TaxID=1839617 RepID=A0A840VGQ9_9ACTN|nr:cellulose binding domain-containing protein [Micromonospora parathelypteridis]MBB5475983.1 cellulase/cellobiase CelA1 [Micromonospora parathelypteridis]
MLRLFLAVTTIALGVWAGTASAADATPTPTPSVTPTPSPTMACPPALPITASLTGATTTSLTISYSIFFRPPCGYDPPMTISLFASREAAQRWEAPVAEAVSGPERSGAVTIGRLTPNTEYWYRFSDAEGRRDPYLVSSARTLSLTACRATATIDARWGNGFVATVTVRNAGTQPLDRWRVSWRWSGDERVQTVWGGVVETAGADVTVRNAPYNGALAPGAVTTFGLLVVSSTVPDGLTMACDS